jgi:hypothetical protein
MSLSLNTNAVKAYVGGGCIMFNSFPVSVLDVNLNGYLQVRPPLPPGIERYDTIL